PMPRKPIRARSSPSRAVSSAGAKAARANALGPWAELIPDAVVSCRAGRIVAINRAGRDLLAGGRQSPIGRALASYIAAPDGDRFMSAGLGRLAQGRQPKPLALIGRAGKSVAVELRAVRLDKAADGALLILLRAQTPADGAADGIGVFKQAVDAIPDAV